MLRSRFESVPYAFSVCFLPERKKDTKREDLVLHFMVNISRVFVYDSIIKVY